MPTCLFLEYWQSEQFGRPHPELGFKSEIELTHSFHEFGPTPATLTK
jgi:hypothetical protein